MDANGRELIILRENPESVFPIRADSRYSRADAADLIVTLGTRLTYWRSADDRENFEAVSGGELWGARSFARGEVGRDGVARAERRGENDADADDRDNHAADERSDPVSRPGPGKTA